MVNEINSVGGSLPGSSRQTDEKAGAVGKTNTGSTDNQSVTASNAKAVSSDDTVKLSDQAKDIARIQRALAQLPEIDEAKVQDIREQISKGSYSVDVEALAEKILADDQFFDS